MELGKFKKPKGGGVQGTRWWGDKAGATNKGQSMLGLMGAWTGFGIYSQEQWAAAETLSSPACFLILDVPLG